MDYRLTLRVAEQMSLTKVVRLLMKRGQLLALEIYRSPKSNEGTPIAPAVTPSNKYKSKTKRNAEIVALYEADPKANSSERLAQRFHINRSRVYQILRKTNSIGLAQERRALAQEALTEEAEKIKAEVVAAQEAEIAEGLRLMREEGLSLRQSSARLGKIKHSTFTAILGKRAKLAGIPTRYGRHRDFSERRNRVVELFYKGFSPPEIVAKMRADGDPHMHITCAHNLDLPQYARGEGTARVE